MLEAVAPHLELFVVAERDARAVLGFAEQAEALAAAIASRYGMPLVALTRPARWSEPGDLLLARGTVRYAPRYPVEIVDRIGAGDLFVGGLIHGLLDGDLDLAIRLAAYAAAVGARDARRHQLFRAGRPGRVRGRHDGRLGSLGNSATLPRGDAPCDLRATDAPRSRPKMNQRTQNHRHRRARPAGDRVHRREPRRL